MPKLIVRPSDYLVTTRELDLFAAIIWAIYAAWGLVTSLNGLATISDLVGEVFNTIWSGAIGVTGLVAAIAATSIFFKTRLSQILKKKIELVATVLLAVLITIYPVYLLILGLFTEDMDRLVTFVLSLLYIVIPIARARILTFRIKNYGITRN